MKTKKEWNQAILEITMKIHEEFPELSKHLKEMPVAISENTKEEIDTNSLKKYYKSLSKMIKEYSKTHQAHGVGKATKVEIAERRERKDISIINHE